MKRVGLNKGGKKLISC